jgi:hypothetical protein
MTNHPRWLCITVGVGSAQYEAAAIRLSKQIEDFEVFDKIQAVLTPELLEICPKLFDWYSKDEILSTKGFGWYAWKSAVAHEALLGRWGDFDGIAYFDSGCEFFLSRPSRARLEKYIEEANTKGTCLFSIPTPENMFTKRDLFKSFPKIHSEDVSNQFQSGSWFFSKRIAQEFFPMWDEKVWLGPEQVDESKSVMGERSDFIVHRHDQSVFSLVAKSLGLKPIDEYPPGNQRKKVFYFRAFFYPFWWSRNRTGQNTIPNLLKILGRATLLNFKK